MPGQSPHAAVRAFLEPLEEGISVLDGVSKLHVLGKKSGYRQGQVYAWTLNGESGMSLRGVGTFKAQMHFEVIEADPEKYEQRMRVTTRGYLYSLEDQRGLAYWRMHWHPNGTSDVDYPHVHVRPDLKQHQATPRMTFEKAITWCIAAGAPLCCEHQEAMNILLTAETKHRLHRSWNERPGEPVG